MRDLDQFMEQMEQVFADPEVSGERKTLLTIAVQLEVGLSLLLDILNELRKRKETIH